MTIDELELTPDEIIRITRGGQRSLLARICFHHFASTGKQRKGRFFFPRTRKEFEYQCEYCGKVRWSV